jgi:hypothetical protein
MLFTQLAAAAIMKRRRILEAESEGDSNADITGILTALTVLTQEHNTHTHTHTHAHTHTHTHT